MKKISFIIITLVLISSGCTEYLTLKPQDELIREEYWKTEGDVVAVLGTAYGKMSNVLDDIYYWAELRGGLLTPDPKKIKPTTLEFFNFNINPYNDKIKWNDFYIIINLANTIIEYAPSAKENDLTFTDVAYNGYIAEAYFIRSLCYFYLVKAFKEVPYITQSYSKDDQDFTYEKSTEQEIIEQLIADLNGIVDKAFKRDYFTDKAEQKGRATVNAVYALLADIYLWNNNYQSCIETCNKINGIFLMPGKDYFDIYGGINDGNSSESIFELQFDYDDYRTTNSYAKDKNLYTLTSNNSEGDKETFVSEFLMGIYDLKDYRQYNNDAEVTFNSSFLSLWKYEGKTPYNPNDATQNHRVKTRSDANWIFYRFSDIRLMMAEAYYELNDLDNSIDQLNRVKIRAGISEYTDKEKLLNELVDERARELVGEGKRWFDLVRICRRDLNNRLPLISRAVISNVDPRSRSAAANKLMDMNSWFLPIYYEELQLNDKLIQNPFYE